MAEIIDQCAERQRCGVAQGQRCLMRKAALRRERCQLRRRANCGGGAQDIDRNEPQDLATESRCRGWKNLMAVEKEANKHAEDTSGGHGAIER